MELRIFGLPIIKLTRSIVSPERDGTSFSQFLDLFGANPTTSGESVTAETSLQFSAVFACVRIISETIASLPINLFEVKNGKSSKNSQLPISKLVNLRPNEIQTKFIFWQTLITHLLLYGNGYARIYRDKNAVPFRLDILHPDTVEPVRQGFKLYYKLQNRQTLLSNYDMLHFVGLNFDGIKGMSVIQAAAENIGVGLAAQKYSGSFYGNGANLDGYLTVPGKLTQEAADRLRESWKKRYAGANNARGTAVLEGGTTYNTVSIKPADAQFIETRRFSVEEIARIFRVPKHLLQDLERSTFSNIEHQSIEFVTHTIRPYVKMIEPELDFKLLTEKAKEEQNKYFKFNLDALLRGDSVSRGNKYKTLFNIGAITQNEIRELEGFNEIEGSGNEYFIQSNMIPAKMGGENFKIQKNG
jgi:HK97 family phage portal protein